MAERIDLQKGKAEAEGRKNAAKEETQIVGQGETIAEEGKRRTTRRYCPSPEFADRHSEDVAEFLSLLDADDRSGLLRRIAEYKLKGWSSEKVSQKLVRIEPTIARKLRRIEVLWAEHHFRSGGTAGENPRIEEYLDEISRSEQRELFERLLSIEVDARRGADENPTPEEYATRFAQHADSVTDVFGESMAAQPASDSTAAPAPLDRQWYELLCDLAFADEILAEDGEVDEFLIAHYLAGDCSSDQCQLVEKAMARDESVRLAVELVQGLDDRAPAEVPLPSDADQKWEQMAKELKSHRDARKRDRSGFDDIKLARYLAGECSDEERRLIEQAERTDAGLHQRLDDLRS